MSKKIKVGIICCGFVDGALKVFVYDPPKGCS